MRGSSSCGHCCCHQESHGKPQSEQYSPPVEAQTGPGCEGTQPAQTAGGLSVTFASSPVVSQSPPVNTSPPLLKPVLKNSSDSTVKKVELRANKNSARPRPRSVAVPNPASSGSGLYSLEEARLVSLPTRPEVPPGH